MAAANMPAIRVIHWKAAEAEPLLEACRRTGFQVDYIEGRGPSVAQTLRAIPFDVLVIDLSRLPAHGREVAIWIRNTKATRAIPILFVGGDPAKVSAIREQLPDADYCEIKQVAAALKRALRRRPGSAEPVIPLSIMDRVGVKPAAQKLGIASGSSVRVVDPPRDFPALLGEIPDGVEFVEDEEAAPVTLWFVHDLNSFLSSLRGMRAAVSRTKLWLIWRKGVGQEITQNTVRETAREVGLVDYKICSVNDRWSGMLFARKKA